MGQALNLLREASSESPKELQTQLDIVKFLTEFSLDSQADFFKEPASATQIQNITVEKLDICGRPIVTDGVAQKLNLQMFINEYWTSKQRQANPLHEISYRACFKPQLPNFFIKNLTQPEDLVYDPFSGRGTTALEAALLGRNVIANDINPLSEILCRPRLYVPDLNEIAARLEEIPKTSHSPADIDLSMFYHEDTLAEILALRSYLIERKNSNCEDELDSWIRMVATNRLTGHSPGFFSVYTLPPNQACSAEKQVIINEKRKQKPEFRDTKRIILKKSQALLKAITQNQRANLRSAAKHARFINCDARETTIADDSVNLTVTSPPFLNVVQYHNDNWLRCWFNNIDTKEVGQKITMTRRLDTWCEVMGGVFKELYRITKPNGYIAFEVGEVEGGSIRLEEESSALAIASGFSCEAIMINQQIFTKTANIWGIDNNEIGTNTNRIVILKKK